MIVVVMGVSGTGKTTVGRALARALGWPFLEGDDFHGARNREKMRSGVPLSDRDREPWLAAIATALAGLHARGENAVLACSALRRRYRDRLRASGAELRFVLLGADERLIAARLSGRSGHYMPASLLPSQLALLERPDASEGALAVDVSGAPAQIVGEIAAWLGAGACPR